MHIFITGFMGVGKTTMGRELSTTLNLPFIDLDEAIEEKAGCTITTLFQTQGEQTFRKIERETLHQVIGKKEQHIVALGGGTMCHYDNAEQLIREGLVVYLYASWEEIEQNIVNLKNRPLVNSNSLSELKAIFEKREPYYRKSQLTMPMNTTFESKKLLNILKILTNR